MKESLQEKVPFKVQLNKFFKDKFNLFALIQLLLSIILFIIMLVLVFPKIIAAITYLHELEIQQDNQIYGYQLAEEAAPIFYLVIFTFNICYAIWGIIQLIKYQHQRSVFKIIFRSIFYIGGLLFVRNIIMILFWLLLPITDLLGLLSIIAIIITLEVAIGGRLVSNFTIFNTSLKNRKNIGFVTILLFLIYCVWCLTTLYDDYSTESLIFYVIETLSSIAALLACIFFKDPIALSFEREPKINKKHQNIVDLPRNLLKIEDHMFAKNTKITRATIPNNIEKIGIGAFANALRLKEVIIPKSVKEIHENAFFNCSNLNKIIYRGTKEEFNQILLKDNWLKLAKSNLVSCSDGIVILDN